MRIAVAQLRSGDDKSANLDKIREAVADAARLGAELVVCPEAAMHDFGPPELPLAPVAEPLDGPFVSALSDLARQHQVSVVAGMFEPVDGDASRAYNTVVALGPAGDLVGRYRKQHLYDALGWLESDRLVAGDVNELLLVPAGDLQVGVMTCYDLRFPELSRALIDAGATVLAVPSAWVDGPAKETQWTALATARAIENVCYVAAAGQPPPTYSGCSRIVDPMGAPLASLAEVEGVVAAEVTAARVEQCRSRMPSLANRRWTVTPRVDDLPPDDAGPWVL
jgi:predicted amidohydrolase